MKFGAIVVAGRGKIGGHVASQNRAGAYLRTKTTPSNPQTVYQTGVRNALSTQSTAWGALTDAQRLEWNAAVEAYKKTDVFGDIRRPSGFNLFVALNNNLVRIGEAAIDVPPLPQELPVITTGVLAATNAGVMTLTFTDDPVVTDSVVEIEATPALSPGRSNVNNQFRLIGAMPALVAHVADIAALYSAKFGAVGAVGQKIFVRLKQVSTTSGQSGVPVVYSDIIG